MAAIIAVDGGWYDDVVVIERAGLQCVPRGRTAIYTLRNTFTAGLPIRSEAMRNDLSGDLPAVPTRNLRCRSELLFRVLGGAAPVLRFFLTGNRLEIEPSLIKTLSEKFFPNRSKLILHSFINVGYLLYFEIIEQTQILVVENHFIVFKICPYKSSLCLVGIHILFFQRLKETLFSLTIISDWD